MFRTSFHTGLLPDRSVTEAARIILDHGYDAVEINGETLPWGQAHVGPETPLSLRRELARIGPVSALCAHHPDFGVADQTRRNAAVAWTMRMIEQTPDYGTTLAHVIPGADADLERLYASLSECVEHAGKHGVTLALEPIVGQRIRTTQGALDALTRVPGLTINFDPSHLQITEHDTPGAIAALGPFTRHVHVKDASGNPDQWSFPKLGTGEIDFTALFRALIQAEYKGFVSIEHESHWFSDDRRAPEDVLTESLAFLHETARRAEAAP